MNIGANILEEDKYCQKCGGLVDFKQCLAKLSAPPSYEYHCSSCYSHVLTVEGDKYRNVQTKSS